MAQQLRALTVLPEEEAQFPAPKWQFTTVTPAPGEPTLSHRYAGKIPMHMK